MTSSAADGLTQEEAEDLLMDAVENIADVQNDYDLDEDMNEMLKDSKSGIAAVVINLDERVVMDV